MAIVVRSRTLIATGFIVFLITTALKGNAQEGSINLNKPVVVQATYIQLDSLLRLITKQTGAKFSLNSRKFPATRSIHINQHKQTIDELLQTIKRNTGVYYALLGDHIILLDNPPPVKKSEAVTTIKKPHLAPAGSPAKSSPPQTRLNTHKPTTTKPPSTISKSQLPHNTADTINKKTTTEYETPVPKNDVAITDSSTYKTDSDTINKPVPPPALKDSAMNKPEAQSRITAADSNNMAAQNKAAKERPSMISDLFIKPGFSIDDVFYVNPTLHIGHPYLYGIASWSTNFKINGFRYGAGTSITFNNDWSLHLQYTTGSYSSSAADTATLSWEFKTTLQKAGIIAETKLNNRLSIQFGPVLNIVQLSFYRNGVSASPGFTEDNANKKFTLIKPLYTLSDNYSTQTEKSSKLWIGLQVSIFYNLHFFKSN